MMKYFYTMLCLLVAVLAQAQNTPQGVCGTVSDGSEIKRLESNLAVAASLPAVAKSGTVQYIPIKFHLVADDNGSGRVAFERVLELVCRLNADYLDQDIQFFILGDFNLVNNSTIYTHTNSAGAGVQMGIRKVNNAMNIFIGNSAGGSSGNGTVLAYYSPARDLIYSTKGVINGTNHSVSHEIGHFFSLPHTFYGWEETDYHANYSAATPPPNSLNYAGEVIVVERADGSNCATAADKICDTPADYNLGLGWQGCTYSGGAVDPTGAAIDPDESNYMGYFDAISCISKFSATQKAVMAADFASSARNYLKTIAPQTTNLVDQVATLTLPANNTVAPFHDEVNMTWNAVPNATQYLVQVSKFSNFALLQEEAFVSTNNYTAENLAASTKYYWRVFGFNELSNCANNGFSASSIFTTGSSTVSTNSIAGINRLEVRPNAAAAGQSVALVVNSDRSFKATLSVFDVTGRLVQQSDAPFVAGENVLALSTDHLQAGMYFISLATANGKATERLFITQ